MLTALVSSLRAAGIEQLRAQSTAQIEQFKQQTQVEITRLVETIKAEGNRVKEAAQLEGDLRAKDAELANQLQLQDAELAVKREKNAQDYRIAWRKLALEAEKNRIQAAGDTAGGEAADQTMPSDNMANDDMTGETPSVVEAIIATLDQHHADQMRAMLQSQAEIARVLAAPVEVMHTPDGRIAGARKVMNGQTVQ